MKSRSHILNEHDSLPPDAGLSIGPLPFIGRDDAMGKLLALYRRAYNGERLIARVAGEMGVGKSRLLLEFCRRSELERAFVVRLRVHRDDDIRDLGSLRAALLDALDARPGLRRQVEMHLESEAFARDGRGSLVRAFGVIARHLLLLLIIDDIDTGNRSASQLAEVLSGLESPLLVVASCAHGWNEHLLRLAHACDAELVSVDIATLDKGDLARQMTALFGAAPGEDDIAWLTEATRGLPVLLREAVHALMRVGCIAYHGGAWAYMHPFSRCRFDPADALPLLRERLTMLPEVERRALGVAALLGRRSPLPAYTMLGFDEGWYTALVARDYLRIDGRHVEFSHDLLYEVVYAEAERHGVAHELRARLIAMSIHEEIDIQLPGRTLRMLLDVSTEEERREVLPMLLEAATIRAQRSEYGSALTYFTECRRWWRELVRYNPPVIIAHYLTAFARMLYALGHVAEQRALLEEFLDPYRDADPPADLLPMVVYAMVQLVEYHQREKKIDTALALLDRASAMLTQTSPTDKTRELERRIGVRRAQILSVLDKRDEASALYLEILRQSDPTLFSSSAYEALLYLSNLSFTTAEIDRVRELLEQMLELCEREGRSRQAIQLRSCKLGWLMHEGRYDDVEPMLVEHLAEMQQYVLPRAESNAWSWLALISAERGDIADALRFMQRAIDIRWRVRSIAMWQLAVITKAQFLVSVGYDEEALTLLDELEQDAAEHARSYHRFVVKYCRSMVAIRRGDWEQERERLGELRALAAQEIDNNPGQLLLILEGEILLRSLTVSLEAADDFIQRMLAEEWKGIEGRQLRIIATSIAGRALDEVSGGKGRRRPSPTRWMLEVVEQTHAVLADWHRLGARYFIAWATRLLREHASHLIPADDLVPYLIAAPLVPMAPSSYHCDILTFGRLRVLDPSGAERGGRHFGTHKSDSKPRKLLAALAAATVSQRRLTRSQLIDMVWEESIAPESSANNFHVTLAGLRQVIGDGIDFDGASYALNPNAVRIDAVRFLALLAEAAQTDQHGRAFQAYDLLTEACSLYTGEFLEGIYNEWSDVPRDLLRAKGRAARLRLVEIALQRGEQEVARQNLVKLFESDATDEEAMYLYLSLMRAEGDRVHALREYDRFATLLAREYGVGPSRKLRALRDAIAAD